MILRVVINACIPTFHLKETLESVHSTERRLIDVAYHICIRAQIFSTKRCPFFNQIHNDTCLWWQICPKAFLGVRLHQRLFGGMQSYEHHTLGHRRCCSLCGHYIEWHPSARQFIYSPPWYGLCDPCRHQRECDAILSQSSQVFQDTWATSTTHDGNDGSAFDMLIVSPRQPLLHCPLCHNVVLYHRFRVLPHF